MNGGQSCQTSALYCKRLRSNREKTVRGGGGTTPSPCQSAAEGSVIFWWNSDKGQVWEKVKFQNWESDTTRWLCSWPAHTKKKYNKRRAFIGYDAAAKSLSRHIKALTKLYLPCTAMCVMRKILIYALHHGGIWRSLFTFFLNICKPKQLATFTLSRNHDRYQYET